MVLLLLAKRSSGGRRGNIAGLPRGDHPQKASTNSGATVANGRQDEGFGEDKGRLERPTEA
jgi:hypothetical protein